MLQGDMLKSCTALVRVAVVNMMPAALWLSTANHVQAG